MFLGVVKRKDHSASCPCYYLKEATVVRLIATQDCYVKFHDFVDDKAASPDMLIKANQPEYFKGLLPTEWVKIS
jgi:hypothetical protein